MSEIALKKNSFFALIISIIPAAVGIATVPILIHLLGLERFSFLSIVWAVVGYFGIFDLGLGRSLSKRAATRHSEKNYALLGKELSFGLLAILILGILAAIIIYLWGKELLSTSFQVSPQFITEAQSSIGVIAFLIPVLMLLSAIKGVFEGLNQFKMANIIQLGNGLINFIIPVIVAMMNPNIKLILLYLLFFRIILLIFCYFYLQKNISLRFSFYFDRSILGEGGWLTLSALASPLMIYVDRVILGTIVPLKNLAFYTTPVDLVSKAWIVPQSITRVTFPAFTFLSKDHKQKNLAFRESLELMALACFIPLIAATFFSYELLQLWIGIEMATQSSLILKILCVGMFWNCLGWISYSYLQATDGVVISGVISIIEVPIYFLALWILSSKFGLLGAALAWSGRLLLDSLIVDIYFLLKNKFLSKAVLWKLGISIIFSLFSIMILISEYLNSIYRTLFGLIIFTLTFYYYFRHPIVNQLYSKLLKKSFSKT